MIEWIRSSRIDAKMKQEDKAVQAVRRCSFLPENAGEDSVAGNVLPSEFDSFHATIYFTSNSTSTFRSFNASAARMRALRICFASRIRVTPNLAFPLELSYLGAVSEAVGQFGW
jgi:hypothetical protein